MGLDSNQPKFSILLPTHNRADVLPFAIRSILKQTLEDFEILVVGDGCTDNTADVVSGFDDKRIRWFDLPKSPNFGYANRNVALRLAKGEFIAFLAHDDIWLPDHLKLLERCLQASGAEIAYSRPLWVIPKGLIAPVVFNLNHEDTLGLFLARAANGIPAGCFAHRRECLEKYGYWNEDLCEAADLDMWARIIEGGHGFGYVPEPTCIHFRANWRTDANAGPRQLRVWRALHTIHDFLPSDLRVDVPQGMTEQEAFWREMENAPARWTGELRAAVDSIMNRTIPLSDDSVQARIRECGIRPEDLIESSRQIEELMRLSDSLCETSIGRRFIRRTRREIDALAPPDTLRGRSWLRVKKALRRTR